MNATYFYIPYKYTFPGTNIHWITFLFIAVEVLILFYQGIYWLSRPTDKPRFWYLVFVILMLLYNTAGGLFVDIKLPVPINIQLYIEVFFGLLVSMYFPFYIYYSLKVKELKFYAVKGSLLFLFLPYLIFFVILNELTGDIKTSLSILVLILIIYGYFYLYRLYRVLLFKVLKDKTYDRSYKERFIGVAITASLWVGCLTCFTFLNLNQYLEHILTNIGFLIMSYIFIRQSIIGSRKEYQELQNINELLTQKVQERTKELEYAIEQKINTFISLAHEIRTPLTLVNNYLDEFINKHGTNEEISIIRDNIEILNNDVNTFFNEEKFRKGLSPHNHNQIISFSKFLLDKIAAFKSYALKKKIILTGNIEQNINIKADPDALHSIVNNLIENAVKFTPENGSIVVSLSAEAGIIQFSVKDSGCGIPRDMQEKIFEPYFQINRENQNYQGIGIGLSVVNNFVKSLDGQVVLKSKENEGSEFIIGLTEYQLSENDFVIDHKSVIPSKFNVFEKELEDAISDNKKESVLIIEDNYNMLRFLRNNLSGNYNVYVADNGRKALLKLKAISAPNLIISDVMMDDMDGFKFLESIADNQDYKHIPCIFLTAKITDRDRLHGLSLGAVDYISKPFSIAELIKKAGSIINNARKQKEAMLSSALEYLTNQKELLNKGTGSIEQTKDVFDSNCKIFGITQREKEIILFIIDGLTYKEIGTKLFLAERTVQKHCENIFNKVKVNSKVELINKFQTK